MTVGNLIYTVVKLSVAVDVRKIYITSFYIILTRLITITWRTREIFCELSVWWSLFTKRLDKMRGLDNKHACYSLCGVCVY